MQLIDGSAHFRGGGGGGDLAGWPCQGKKFLAVNFPCHPEQPQHGPSLAVHTVKLKSDKKTNFQLDNKLNNHTHTHTHIITRRYKEALVPRFLLLNLHILTPCDCFALNSQSLTIVLAVCRIVELALLALHVTSKFLLISKKLSSKFN